jgi:ABC-type sugar transport system substrate-binding protein
MAAFMRPAARSLGIELETIGCFRDHDRIRREGKALIEHAAKPDVLLIPNSKGLALELIPQADAVGIRVFLVNEGLLVAERGTLGEPGRKHRHWLGEIVPDERAYGHSLATYLIEEARNRGLAASDGRIHVGALTGGFNYASISRIAGLKAAAAADRDVVLGKLQTADWDRGRARELTAQVLSSDPETAVIWCASDLMALGAIDAIESAGREPGRDILVGGVDWAPFAPEKIGDGVLTASAGSHFMDGAWALVMVCDREQGIEADIAHARSRPALLDRSKLDAYGLFFDESAWATLDFTRFSMARNPSLRSYDFGVDAVLRAAGR